MATSLLLSILKDLKDGNIFIDSTNKETIREMFKTEIWRKLLNKKFGFPENINLDDDKELWGVVTKIREYKKTLEEVSQSISILEKIANKKEGDKWLESLSHEYFNMRFPFLFNRNILMLNASILNLPLLKK